MIVSKRTTKRYYKGDRKIIERYLISIGMSVEQAQELTGIYVDGYDLDGLVARIASYRFANGDNKPNMRAFNTGYSKYLRRYKRTKKIYQTK